MKVNKQEKKKFLQDYKWIITRLDAIEQEAQKPISKDDVQYKGKKAEKDAVKHISKGERLNVEKQNLLDKKRRIENAIATVTDNRENILLRSMYISGKSAIEVAFEMDISIRTIYRILNSAIDHLQIEDGDPDV